MRLGDVRTLQEAPSAQHAEELIKAGWTLVAIVSGERYESGQKAQGPIYVLAQAAPESEPAKDINFNWV
ncbi:hypothetical protein [Pseudomonas ficuserectae]|uniref:Uncharacterized protein n=1 Tax=Pseudomonas amygdali pv. mori str. 301020 TaxID=629261 RepID=A0A656GE56_PSEA0|nr:hypothetical protein [Pseudomonas ficuserectae]EGH24062.1 hypothetical protein PSYMO_22373 [Pseudomonas amygdali pv. mori str. 301020]